MILGHDHVLALAPTPVLLLNGPRGVGKWTVAEHLAKRWGAKDVIRLRRPEGTDLMEAMAVARFRPEVAPRVVILRLGSSAMVQHHLLRGVEDAQETCFMLLSSVPQPMTVVSRAAQHYLKPLAPEQVSALLQRQGLGKKQSDLLASMGDGTVRGARAAGEVIETKPVVLKALTAIRDQDPVALDRISLTWNDVHTMVLRRWCNEVLSGFFVIFKEEEAILSRAMAVKILIAVAKDVRPRLQVRAGLMGLVVK